MHLEFLVEDLSGKIALDAILPRIVGHEHTYTINSYRGIGRIPRNLSPKTDPAKRVLLDQLPRLLRGLGKTFASYGGGFPAAVVVVCDLDRRCLKEFRQELLGVVADCQPAPQTKFCIAVEEAEAWFLGDPSAIRRAYPKAKMAVVAEYANDSICGTWEHLAEAVHPSGRKALDDAPYYVVGTAKCEWAAKIAPEMDVEVNASASFAYFRDSVRALLS